MIGKRLRKNSSRIALNISCIKEKKIYPASISKYNSAREKQIIISMIPNEEKD